MAARQEQVARLVKAEAAAREATRRGDNDGVRASRLARTWSESTQQEKDAFGDYLHSSDYR